MKRFKFPIAVAITSFALVMVVGALAVLSLPFGALAARTALANAPWNGGPGFNPWGFGGPGFTLPPELQGLGDLPPAERFAHFVGVRVTLKDKDNRPFTVDVIPGTATEVGANSLTIAANDGTARSFVLDDKTFIPGRRVQDDARTTKRGLSVDDMVVVVTFNDETTARFILNCADGSGPGGFGGPPPWARFARPHWGR